MPEETNIKLLMIGNKSDIKVFVKFYISVYLDESGEAQGVISAIFFEEKPKKDGKEVRTLCIDPQKIAITPIKQIMIVSSNSIGLMKINVMYSVTGAGGIIMEIVNKENANEQTPTTLN